MGLCKLHGLRHAYAQNRYYELTRLFDSDKKGWRSPVAGGPLQKSLNTRQKTIDLKVRHMISRELGHVRVAITKIYLN